jgi:hypothetical protein
MNVGLLACPHLEEQCGEVWRQFPLWEGRAAALGHIIGPLNLLKKTEICSIQDMMTPDHPYFSGLGYMMGSWCQYEGV